MDGCWRRGRSVEPSHDRGHRRDRGVGRPSFGPPRCDAPARSRWRIRGEILGLFSRLTVMSVGDAPCARLAAVEHHVCTVLRRGPERSAGPIRPAGDLQYRPGQPVHQLRAEDCWKSLISSRCSRHAVPDLLSETASNPLFYRDLRPIQLRPTGFERNPQLQSVTPVTIRELRPSGFERNPQPFEPGGGSEDQLRPLMSTH